MASLTVIAVLAFIRYTRRGDMQMLFTINPRICTSCPVKQHCLSDDSKGTNGRRFSVIRAKLPALPTVALEPEMTIIVMQHRAGFCSAFWHFAQAG